MAGIIAGCITVTGLASRLISGVIAISGAIASPMLATLIALFLTMLCCIVLGMGARRERSGRARYAGDPDLGALRGREYRRPLHLAHPRRL